MWSIALMVFHSRASRRPVDLAVFKVLVDVEVAFIVFLGWAPLDI
jgi:hypothetical protein